MAALHHTQARAAVVAVLLVSCVAGASAQQDRNAERAARRLQLQMQTLQQQLQDAQAAKAKADADNAALTQRLQAGAGQLAAAEDTGRKLEKSLKDALAERAQLSASVADLQKKLADQQHGAEEAAAAKDQTLASAQQAREQERKQFATRDADAAKTLAECSTKNQRLVALGADLLDRYRAKGVLAALKQNEPVLGLGDVEMFNVVQDYRDKLAAERYAPPAVTR